MAETVGKIYSTALFELCCEQDSLETVYSEFTEIMQLLVSGEDEREYLRFLASPLISSADKTGSINAIFGGKVSDMLADFLCLVTEKNRADRLEEIYGEFRRMYNDHRNLLEVTAITTEPLKEELKKRLIEKLHKSTGRDIVLTEKVDKSIIGGMIVRYGNTEIDSSVRTRLEKLKAQITGTIA